ncbi:hypothetical protein [Sporisorium scitamineum]|uniref:Uncharacterized protein n=1 Tax=Sporisorium scitamineum TaxID=49012 RepID=A0A0F7RSM9_9BASI|nr:hypothetical protein [Sporisorium scitamineum]
MVKVNRYDFQHSTLGIPGSYIDALDLRKDFKLVPQLGLV